MGRIRANGNRVLAPRAEKLGKLGKVQEGDVLPDAEGPFCHSSHHEGIQKKGRKAPFRLVSVSVNAFPW